VPADQEPPSSEVLAALVVSLRGELADAVAELARATERIAELEDRLKKSSRNSYPQIRDLAQLTRAHIEDFLAYNHKRPWRGRVACDQPVAPAVSKCTVIDLRCFLDDLALCGWTDRPPAPRPQRNRRGEATSGARSVAQPPPPRQARLRPRPHPGGEVGGSFDNLSYSALLEADAGMSQGQARAGTGQGVP
jgi:hypothetical protein